MRKTLQLRILPICTALAFALASSTCAQENKACSWVDNDSWAKSLKTLQKPELQAKLEEHKKHPDIPLDLSGTNLFGQDLHDANLIRANLSGSLLMSANLKGATLRGANLRCAVLTGADMTGAILNGTQMSGANFEPDVNPELRGISQATDLELLTYDDTPDALVQLSNDFRNGGYDEQARQVTFAKKRRDTQRLWKGCNLSQLFHNCAAALFNWVFFDLTCRYGMRPGLTLLCVGGMWLICSFIYPVFMACPGSTGLYIFRKRTQKGTERDQRIFIKPRKVWKLRFGQDYLYIPYPELRVLRVAICFSLLSAFNVGFREFNIGQWLHLLMKQEYDIKAVGWARTVAGVQSLVSVYLVAMWLLTTFGHPFY